MQKIEFFGHSHPLKFYSSEFFQDDDPDFYLMCQVCDQKIDSSRSAYGCRKCNYFIDISCGELQRHLKHPFHPQHTLISPNDSSDRLREALCNACGLLELGKYKYRCSECTFYLDIDCARLAITRENGDEMHLIDQPHPMFLCDKPAGYRRTCSCCFNSFSEADSKIYVCVECKHLLHESCASLKEIKHPFHIEHPLTVLSPSHYGNNIKCNACSSPQNVLFPYMFQCKQCDFALDFWCASLVPASKGIEINQEVQKPDLNHKHPLIECNFPKDFGHLCRVCYQSFEDSIFVCLECGILLDRRCANLPLEVNHPCHPHVFRLNKKEQTLDYECWLCCAHSQSVFVYSCDCNIQLEPSCALTKPSIINSVFHEHPLAYFKEEFIEEIVLLRCNECNEDCRGEFLHCGECKYSSHLCCYPNLPPVIKHSCHCDPLTLIYSKIKDAPDEEEDDEFYCNACEGIRDLRYPTYYCQACHFAAHPHCVSSEIILYMETGSIRQSLGNIELDTSLHNARKEAMAKIASSTGNIFDIFKSLGIKDSPLCKQIKEEPNSSPGDESKALELSAEETVATLE